MRRAIASGLAFGGLAFISIAEANDCGAIYLPPTCCEVFDGCEGPHLWGDVQATDRVWIEGCCSVADPRLKPAEGPNAAADPGRDKPKSSAKSGQRAAGQSNDKKAPPKVEQQRGKLTRPSADGVPTESLRPQSPRPADERSSATTPPVSSSGARPVESSRSTSPPAVDPFDDPAAQPTGAPAAVEPTPAPIEPTPAPPGAVNPAPVPAEGDFSEASPSDAATTTAPAALPDRYGSPPQSAASQPRSTESPIEPIPTEPAGGATTPAPSPIENDSDEPAAPATSAEPSAKPTPSPTTAPPGKDEASDQPEEAPTPELEDLFNEAAPPKVLTLPGGWASTTDRMWRDAAGKQVARARLVGVDSARVLLRRDHGETLVLNFRELCTADLEFVAEQVEARCADLGDQAGHGQMLATQDF
jgi:hypothetical protein